MGSVGSGNKLKRQNKGPWSLGERKAKVTSLGARRGEKDWWVCSRGIALLNENLGEISGT